MARFTKAQQDESRQNLKDALERATRDRQGRPIIYTVLRTVSKSGMSRRITPFVIDATTAEPVSLAWDYERSHGRMADDSTGRWACKVQGCGMDMGFHLADNIAATAGLKSLWVSHEWL